MTEYKCKRCGYNCKLYADYKKHLNRKTLCKPILADIPIDVIVEKNNKKYKCLNCDKMFSHTPSLYRHQKECILKKSQENINKLFEQKIFEMSEKIKELENKNTTTNIINNNNTINNNININAYGSLKPEITYTELENLLKIGAAKAIRKLIDINHFNKEHPENMNFYISNYKDNIGRIFDGEVWTIKNGDDLVDEVYDLYQSLIDNVIEDITYYSEDETEQQNHKTKLLDKLNNAIEIWCKRTNNNKFINGFKEELKRMFHGKKEIVKKVHNIKI
jgi:hypothetical protein